MPLLKNQFERENPIKFSTFGIVEKTLAEIVERLMTNERLKKLLYYTDPKALHMNKLTPQQSLELVQNQIKIVPKLNVLEDAKPYIIITLDDFRPSNDQTTFRTCGLRIDIICDYDYWKLEDFQLRPYSIAGEIDAMINRSYFSHFGIASFNAAKNIVISPESGGIVLLYTLDTMKDDVKQNINE